MEVVAAADVAGAAVVGGGLVVVVVAGAGAARPTVIVTVEFLATCVFGDGILVEHVTVARRSVGDRAIDGPGHETVLSQDVAGLRLCQGGDVGDGHRLRRRAR